VQLVLDLALGPVAVEVVRGALADELDLAVGAGLDGVDELAPALHAELRRHRRIIARSTTPRSFGRPHPRSIGAAGTVGAVRNYRWTILALLIGAVLLALVVVLLLG
jgi:hypothetical protein